MKITGNTSASTSKTGERFTGKGLINVGIFTAIYFVVVFAVACLGFIPILMAAICGIIPLIAGIPYMLFLTRARKFGMITILGLLTGIIMFVAGMGYFSIATGLIFGLIADLIWKSGGYASASRAVLSHGVFSCWIIGNFLPFLITADTYLPTVRAQYGDAYVNELMTYLQPEMYPVLLVACFVAGIIGGFIGCAILKKHFDASKTRSTSTIKLACPIPGIRGLVARSAQSKSHHPKSIASLHRSNERVVVSS